MRKIAFILGLLAMLGFLAAPAWAGPTALSDTEMDDVFAQGIVIQNTTSDDDTFASAQTQGNWNAGTNDPTTGTTVGAQNDGGATGGNARDADAGAGTGDTGSIAMGGAYGGGAMTDEDPRAWGGDTIDSDTQSFDENSYNGGPAAADSSGSSEGGDAGVIPVALASGGDADANAGNDAGDAGNLGLAAALGLGLNLGMNDFDNDNRAMSFQASLNFVWQEIYLEDFAMASDYSIAYHEVGGTYLQSQANGPNAFNNSQNQLEGNVNNEAQISTDVHNAALAGTWAAGYAESSPADANANNNNQTTQVPVAVNVSANLGAAMNGTETLSSADGGENGQDTMAPTGNLGLAGAGTDADADAGAIGLGLAGAQSNTSSGGGDGGDTDVTSADGSRVGNGGRAWADGARARAGTGVATQAGTGWIDQDATAANAQDAQGATATGGDQDAAAYAASMADTDATLGQQADSGPSNAQANNGNGQDADANATSAAQNTTAAFTDNTTAAVAVDQVIAVKSVVVYDQSNNSGVVNNSAQGAVSQQQINALPINTAAFGGPVNMGNAVAINAIFN
jgi:hypothetical protein